MNELVLYKSANFQGVECDFWKNENNEVFMTAEQLGMVMGYAHPRKAINKIALRNPYLLNEEFSTGTKMVSPLGFQETRIFTEDGIYEVSMLSKTQKGLEFRSWIRKILKGIRKGELEILKKQIEECKPKLELYEQCISAENYMSMLQVSKILKMSGRNTLYKFLRDEHVLMSKGERHNLPYQCYIEQKYFTVVVKPMIIGRKIIDVSVTLVSARGLQFIQKRLRQKKERLAEKRSQLTTNNILA